MLKKSFKYPFKISPLKTNRRMSPPAQMWWNIVVENASRKSSSASLSIVQVYLMKCPVRGFQHRRHDKLLFLSQICIRASPAEAKAWPCKKIRICEGIQPISDLWRLRSHFMLAHRTRRLPGMNTHTHRDTHTSDSTCLHGARGGGNSCDKLRVNNGTEPQVCDSPEYQKSRTVLNVLEIHLVYFCHSKEF